MYVLISKCQGHKDEYYAIDKGCGEPYFTSFLNNAKIFKCPDEIDDILNGRDFQSLSEMNDGTIYPPRMVHMACHINKDHQRGQCELVTAKVEFKHISSRKMSGEIKEPTGYTYD